MRIYLLVACFTSAFCFGMDPADIEHGLRSNSPLVPLTASHYSPEPPPYEPQQAHITRKDMKKIRLVGLLASIAGIANFAVDTLSHTDQYNYLFITRCLLNVGVIMGGYYTCMQSCGALY